MEKLTLSIKDKETIDWIKSFAKANDTNVSRIFESHIEALKAFEQQEVELDDAMKDLIQPGERPSKKEIDRHLAARRRR
ncbi:MAG: DUF6364 family protein [Bacteroidota bacterium]